MKEVIDIDFDENKVVTYQTYPYSYLILSHGFTINTFGIKGVDENCFFKNDEQANIPKVTF